MNKRGRYVLQRQASTSHIWRTVLRTDNRESANARFLAQSTQVKPGCSVRLIDEWDDLVLAKHPPRVHTELAYSTC